MNSSPPEPPSVDHTVLIRAVAEMLEQVQTMSQTPQTVKPQQLNRLVARLHLVCDAVSTLPPHQAAQVHDCLIELSHTMEELEDVLPKK